MTISISQKEQKPKVYTHGFTPTQSTLQDLANLANNYSISGPTYKDGHRSQANIISGSNVILIDVDEPNQAQMVQQKLKHYDYVKVPSRSNPTANYKWHFIVPTQSQLSIYPAAFKWQIEQFFNQVGITSDMIDASSSYDIARQFAPALFQEADDLSTVNETGIQAPIMDAPQELQQKGLKSITPTIHGTQTDTLPQGHLWFNGEAITYSQAQSIIHRGSITSGFGCPHDNQHTDDNTRGYGFGFIGEGGDYLIRCSGNACSSTPLFVLPLVAPQTNVANGANVDESHPLTVSFEKRWTSEAVIGNATSSRLREAWNVNFNSYEECITRNLSGDTPQKIVVPAITGSGKTQTMYHMARSLKDTTEGMLIVTSRTADADQACLEIRNNDDPGFCAVHHTNPVRNEAVTKTKMREAYSYQVLIITHEMYRRTLRNKQKRKALLSYPNSSNGERNLIVIDEQISMVIDHSIAYSQLDRIDRLFDRLLLNPKRKDNKQLEAEAKVLKRRKHTFLEWMKKGKQFMPRRPDALSPEYYMTQKIVDQGLEPSIPTQERAEEIIAGVMADTEMSQMIMTLENLPVTGESISRILGEKDSRHKDDAYRHGMIETLKSYNEVFTAWAYFIKSGDDGSLNTAHDILPDKTAVILDATSSENYLYQVRQSYKDDIILKPQIPCRNFSDLTIHIKKMNTGRSAISSDLITNLTALADDIKSRTTGKDEVMVVTAKQFKPQLMTYLPEQCQVAHWGDLTGRNDWQYCNKQFIFGLNHKSPIFARNNHTLAKGALEAFEESDVNKRELSLIQRTDRIQETIQAIMRTRARRVINEEGDNELTDIYMTISPSDYPSMVDSLQRYLLNVNITEWELTGTKEPLPRGKYLEAVFELLSNELTEPGNMMSLMDIKHALNMDPQPFKVLMNKPYFKRKLEEDGYRITVPPGQVSSRGKPMKKGKRYIERMR